MGAVAAKGKKKKGKETATKGSIDIEGGLGGLEWNVICCDDKIHVFVEATMTTRQDATIQLHWGCQEVLGGEWSLPSAPVANAASFGDGKASRTVLVGQARSIITFLTSDAPAAISFVLFVEAGGAEAWLKTSAGGDFIIEVKPGEAGVSKVDEVSKKFCDAETHYSHWSQFQRICLANEYFSKPGKLSKSEAAWLACDLRLAQAKVLEWYRNRGYQPKDMAHAQEALGGHLPWAVKKAGDATERALLRLCAPAVPRGSSGGGDAIRHGILNIMRTHGIKEGHRPGIECPFIEQWHQKLHTNSAPDDITICEGYLAFLASGNVDDMWRTIWERGRITREDLSKMCTCGFVDHTKSGRKGLDVIPRHLPQLTHDMNNYLGLLKHVHGGSDLFSLCEACKGQYPDHGAECLAFDIYNNRNDAFSMGKIIELRRKLQHCLDKRDLLMLDVALEDLLRSLAERADLASFGRKEDVLAHLRVVLEDLRLSRVDLSLDQGAGLFERLAFDVEWCKSCGLEPWSVEWCKLTYGACERLALVCAGTADAVATLLQDCADKLTLSSQKPGAVFKPDGKALANFGEETGRCLTERVVAQILKYMMPILRRGAGLGPWEIVSPGRSSQAAGTVSVMASLPLSLEFGAGPMVAICETMTGWEDIPAGVVAVLLPSTQAVDVLSHVAIRARNQQVLLASCDDEGLLEEIKAAAASPVRLEVGPSGAVTWNAMKQEEWSAHGASGPTSPAQLDIKITKPPPVPQQVLASAQFVANAKSIGGKSLHLAELRPDSGEYTVPACATVPFGMFEQVLLDASNESFSLAEVVSEGSLAEVRKSIVDELAVPDALQDALIAACGASGASPLPDSLEWQRALKGVWASKWTDRAVSSRQQCGVKDDDVYMAVLVQPLIDAQYAFVIHTRSPLTGAKADEQLVELCVGLGESLVSNSPGRALSASVGPTDDPVVHTYPSKPDGVFAPEGGTHIFRSDSNAEDLEGFAGAGLYDSITVVECLHRPVCYTSEPLLFDSKVRNALLRKLYDLGRMVEANFNGQPQDIEGAVCKDGSLVVTQSRPQV
jgi:alpha-glucan,water dikinase